MGWLLSATAGAAVGVVACVWAVRLSFERQGRQLEHSQHAGNAGRVALEELRQKHVTAWVQHKHTSDDLKRTTGELKQVTGELKHTSGKLKYTTGELKQVTGELDSAKQHLRCALDECTLADVTAFSPSQVQAYLEACSRLGVRAVRAVHASEEMQEGGGDKPYHMASCVQPEVDAASTEKSVV